MLPVSFDKIVNNNVISSDVIALVLYMNVYVMMI